LKICLLGNQKYKEEILFMKKEFEKTGNFVETPNLDFKSELEKTKMYSFVREVVRCADFIILICESFTDKDFIFYGGLAFGLEKKFRTTSIKSIRNLMNDVERKTD